MRNNLCRTHFFPLKIKIINLLSESRYIKDTLKVFNSLVNIFFNFSGIHGPPACKRHLIRRSGRYSCVIFNSGLWCPENISFSKKGSNLKLHYMKILTFELLNFTLMRIYLHIFLTFVVVPSVPNVVVQKYLHFILLIHSYLFSVEEKKN